MLEVLKVLLKAVKDASIEHNPHSAISWNDLIKAIEARMRAEGQHHSENPLSRLIAKEENHLL